MTFSQMLADLKVKLSVANNNFYTDDVLKGFLNDGYRYVCSLHPWSQLERQATTFTTVISDDSYTYPSPSTGVIRTNGITRVEVEDSEGNMVPYTKLGFPDFRQTKYENSSEDSKYYADYNRTIYLLPVPDAVYDVYVWGIIEPAALSSDSDVTVFDTSEKSINEAIIRMAVSYAYLKATRANEAAAERALVVELLAPVWDYQSKVSSKSQRTNTEWGNPDLFPKTFR